MKKHFPIFCAFPAAVLYALNAPVSKLLLKSVPPTMMAAFLYLGAARTSAYYAVQPFIGAALSLIFLRTLPGALFYPALLLMIFGTCLLVGDQKE